MGQIKSSWEIALERASAVKALTPEAEQAIKIKEYAPIGRGLAERCLQGALMVPRDLLLALDKYPEAATRQIVFQAFCTTMLEALKVDAYQTPLAALLAVFTDRQTQAVGAEIRALCAAYTQEIQETAATLTETYLQATRKELKQAGISGSAVKLKLEATKKWQATESLIWAEYQQKLIRLKEKLAAGVNTGTTSK